MTTPHKKPATQLPGRQKVAYAAVPVEYAALLDGLTKDSAKYEGRSRTFLVKLALRKFLQGEGLLDEHGKPRTDGNDDGTV